MKLIPLQISVLFRKKWYSILGGFILIFYLATRLYSLNTIPGILNPDEASIGYNAYLLLETGTDEWGERWPLVLQAFGDQKVIGYTALVVPMIALFGMQDFAVRLPVVIAGLGILLLTYQLLQSWGVEKRTRLLALTLLSIQPFFVWYTRVGFEATVSLFFVLILVSVFFTDRFKNSRLASLLLIIVATLGSILLYNAPLILIPFLVVLLPVANTTKKNSWRIWLPIAITTLACWGILFLAMQQLSAQKSQITIFGNPTTYAEYVAYRQGFAGNAWVQKFVGNKYVFFSQTMLKNTASQFHPGFLINNSPGHPWHALHQTGYIYFSTWIAAMCGVLLAAWQLAKWLYLLIQKRSLPSSMNWQALLFVVMLIALVPVAISTNAPHATRALLFFWILILFAANSLGRMLTFIETHPLSKRKPVLIGLLGLSFLVFFIQPATVYFIALFHTYPQNPRAQAVLQSEYAQTIQVIEQQARMAERNEEGEYELADPSSQATSYSSVVVVDPRGFHYILTAWYTQLPPSVFRETVVRRLPDTINFRYGEQLGRYRFVMDKWDVVDEDIRVYWDQDQLKWKTERKQWETPAAGNIPIERWVEFGQ